MPDTSQMMADEIRGLLRSQQEADGPLQPRLEGLVVAKCNSVTDFNVEAVQQFLGGDKVAICMQLTGEAMRDYVRSADVAPVRPPGVLSNAMECP